MTLDEIMWARGQREAVTHSHLKSAAYLNDPAVNYNSDEKNVDAYQEVVILVNIDKCRVFQLDIQRTRSNINRRQGRGITK